MELIPLDRLRINGGTQSRVAIDQDTVAEYAECADALPPGVAFFDGSDYWLSDGFHRFFGRKKADKSDMAIDVRPGTQRDAILHSTGVNHDHGLRRTNADKQRAVETLLKDEEWGKRSDAWISEQAKVGDGLVAKYRKMLFPPETSTSFSGGSNGRTKRTGKDGKNHPASKGDGAQEGDTARGEGESEEDLNAKEKREKELHDRIRVYLEANPKASNKGAAKELDCSEHTVKKVKDKIEEEWEAKQTVFCRPCRTTGKKPKCPECKTARDLAATEEKEEEEKPEATIDDKIKEHNRIHESWCRDLAKLAETMPDGPWIQDLNRREGAQRKLRDAAETVRSAKCSKPCPQCVGSGCKICHKTGMITTHAAKQL